MVPVKFLGKPILGYHWPMWILIAGLLLFAAAALNGEWDVFMRVGIVILILDRMFS